MKWSRSRGEGVFYEYSLVENKHWTFRYFGYINLFYKTSERFSSSDWLVTLAEEGEGIEEVAEIEEEETEGIGETEEIEGIWETGMKK